MELKEIISKPEKLTREEILYQTKQQIEFEKQQFGVHEEKHPDPLFSWQGIGRYLDNEPEPQKFIFEHLLPANVVGMIPATGGTGKTMFLLQLACYAAAKKQFGAFKPIKPVKTLFLGGEDATDIFHRRLYTLIPTMEMNPADENLLRQNIEVISLVGQDRFLTQLDESNNPRTTETYKRLQATIENIPDLDLLIIDPKSRFDGLSENSNEHGTYFISCLEKLIKDHNITILFSHHESKNTVSSGELKNSSGRGASALRDGCRWVLSLGLMQEKEAEKHCVDPKNFIEAMITKNNYATKGSHSHFFERGEHGILKPADLYGQRLDQMLSALMELLCNSCINFTESELVKGGSKEKDNNEQSKHIADSMQERFPGFRRTLDMKKIIDYAKQREFLIENFVLVGKKKRGFLNVSSHYKIS